MRPKALILSAVLLTVLAVLPPSTADVEESAAPQAPPEIGAAAEGCAPAMADDPLVAALFQTPYCSYDCPDGTKLECYDANCSAGTAGGGRGYVTCNGTTTYCEWQCSISCREDPRTKCYGMYSCTGRYDSQLSIDVIECDGTERYCIPR